MKKVLLGLSLLAVLAASGIALAKPATLDDAAMDARVQVAKLRGKLVYKKGQIRKLERAACESNGDLKRKVEELEREKRNNYIAVEPKLKTLYAEQDALDAEIARINSGAKPSGETE